MLYFSPFRKSQHTRAAGALYQARPALSNTYFDTIHQLFAYGMFNEFMNNTVDFRQLQCFVAVAEELHFGRAADRLGMAQPPLSQHIKSLEAMIGHPLFERKPRVRLTAAGEALLVVARRTFAQVEEGLDFTRRAGRGETGKLTVGFAASILTTALPEVLRDYRARFPDVELRLRELSTAAQGLALSDGVIDVGFVREAVELRADLICEPLVREEFVAVLPPSHPLAAAGQLPLGALADEPFVHFPRAVAPALYDQIADACRRAGFRPRVVQEAQEWLTILGLVEAGLGVSLVPASFRRLRWGGVQYKPLGPPREFTEVFVCRRAAPVMPTVIPLIEIARATMAAQTAWPAPEAQVEPSTREDGVSDRDMTVFTFRSLTRREGIE
jgi:DNA-binding transcriptional LysR family regulator